MAINKEYARDVLQIVKHILEDKNSEIYQNYKSGQISFKGLVKIATRHYLDAKVEELTNDMESEEQIYYIFSLAQGMKAKQEPAKAKPPEVPPRENRPTRSFPKVQQ